MYVCISFYLSLPIYMCMDIHAYIINIYTHIHMFYVYIYIFFFNSRLFLALGAMSSFQYEKKQQVQHNRNLKCRIGQNQG